MAGLMFKLLRENLARIVEQHNLGAEEISIRAFPLSPEEAIGNPEERDYPLVKGRERLMQAEFRGSKGQAYTDMYGDFSGKLSEILEMDLRNNFRRAIFVSTLNAVMRYLGMVERTVHCRNEEPRGCAQELVKYIRQQYGKPKIAFIGFQPRMVEALSREFELRVTDLDEGNIGQERFGVRISGPEETGEILRWCDMAIVTGTTLVNDTIGQFRIPKPVLYYGVTISGAAKLLQLSHFCYYGH
ncbi:MAG: hypothetical protein DRI26_04380 [Chloroflexi bacterium]|nr:MAG: hypothetical protein DRI26_04380 [Chloroflexota bacterium]